MQSQLSSVLDILAQPFYPSFSSLPVLVVLHAFRVSISWHQLRPSKTELRGSVLQDLCGYFVLAFGGSTLIAILLREPLVWLTSPTIVIVYTAMQLLLQPILPIVMTLFPPEALTVLLTAFDSLYRSFSLLSIHTNLAARSDSPIGLNPLAGPILSAINVSGGRGLVSLFGLSNSRWTLQTPVVFTNRHLYPWVELVDIWSSILGIGILQWSTRSAGPSSPKGREEQAMCALTIAVCLSVVKLLALKGDGRLPSPPLLRPSALLSRDPSLKDVFGLAEPPAPSEPTTNFTHASISSLESTSSLSGSPISPSGSSSPTKSASLTSSAPASSSSPIVSSTPLSPPPVIHRDFFKPDKPLSEGRKKTIEIRNRELRRRADELSTTFPSVVPHSASTSSTPPLASSYSPPSPSSAAASVSRKRSEKSSWDNEPTLIRNRGFASIGSGKTKIKNLLGGK